jgi:hypothetical protein
MSNSCKFKLRYGPFEEIHEQFLLPDFCQNKLTLFRQCSEFILNNITAVICKTVADNGMTSIGQAVCPHTHPRNDSDCYL